MPDFKTAAGMLLAVFLLSAPGISEAMDSNQQTEGYRPDTAFKEIVNAWKDGRFDELYDRGSRTSRDHIARQEFVRLMQNSNIRLQCCWATVQNVKWASSVSSGTYVTALLGYQNFSKMGKDRAESGSSRLSATSIFKDDTFQFNQEEGLWKIDLSDILSAEGYVFAYPVKKNRTITATESPKDN
jgi:hypothetical protein